MFLQLFDIELGLFAPAGPNDAFSLLVDVEHHLFGFFAAVAKNAADHHGDVGHEIDRIVMHNHMPWLVEAGAFLLLDDREGFGFRSWQGSHGKVMRNIRQNLFFAFAYNAVGIPVAAGVLYPFTGWLLNPMIAGAAMALSSVSVIGNSLRLRNMD